MDLILFMIITPPDIGIACYTVKALKKLLKQTDDISIVLYFNGLSISEEEIISNIVDENNKFIIKSNKGKINEIKNNISIGKYYVTDQGKKELRQGLYENASEIWSRELIRLDSPVVGIIDADYEVFDINLIKTMLSKFDNTNNLGFFSIDHSNQKKVYDTYSKQDAILMPRYHTWLCLYRKDALYICHDFTFKEYNDIESEMIIKYDHSSWLQEKLNNKGWCGAFIENEEKLNGIHYGAFAKNKELYGYKLFFYRIIRIMRYNGFRYIIRSTIISKIISIIGRILYIIFKMSKCDNKRLKYIYEQ